MKRSTAFLLLLGVCFVSGLVIYATMSQVGARGSIDAWLIAHRDTPALWTLDAAAVYALLLTVSYSGQSVRLEVRRMQGEQLQEEHRMQLEAMLTNTEKADEINVAQEEQLEQQQEKLAAQGARIAAQEETINSLSAQADALQQELAQRQMEIDSRQLAFADEARLQMEQTLRALSQQVDAQARQLEAVNLALQYHRAEIQQLRVGLRAMQASAQLLSTASIDAAVARAIEPGDADSYRQLNAAVLSDISTPDISTPDSSAPDISTPDSSAPDSSAPAAALPAARADEAVAAPDATLSRPAAAETADFAAPELEIETSEAPTPAVDMTAETVAVDHADAAQDVAPTEGRPAASELPAAPAPASGNEPVVVVMEPLYFQIVPAGESDAAPGADDLPAREPQAGTGAPSAPTEGITLDDAHALVTSPPDLSVPPPGEADQPGDGSLPFALYRSSLRMARQRKQ